MVRGMPISAFGIFAHQQVHQQSHANARLRDYPRGQRRHLRGHLLRRVGVHEAHVVAADELARLVVELFGSLSGFLCAEA